MQNTPMKVAMPMKDYAFSGQDSNSVIIIFTKLRRAYDS